MAAITIKPPPVFRSGVPPPLYCNKKLPVKKRRFLHPLDIFIKEKTEAMTRSYGASGVEYLEHLTS